MYAAPPTISTTALARLPQEFRKAGGNTPWTEARPDKKVDSFLEGPVLDRQGNFFCTDIPFGRIFRVSPEGAFSLVLNYEGEPNGMRLHRDGRAFIADHRRGLLSLDLETRVMKPVLERAWGEGLRGLNDLTFAANGDLYFTDQGQSGLQDPSGRVFRLRTNGVLECVLDRIPSPNGLAFSPDESLLYVAVTRANAVWRLPLDRNGHATKVGVFLHLSGGGGPDGLAVDEAGNLLVAHPGSSSVWVFSPQGEPIHRILSCAGKRPTNITFGGADNRTLYITESESGSILTAQLSIPGVRLYGLS